MVTLGAELGTRIPDIPDEYKKGVDPSISLLWEIRTILEKLPDVISGVMARSAMQISSQTALAARSAVASVPAPIVNVPEARPVVHVDAPDLSEIVMAVTGLKPGATAEDIGQAIARNLNPAPVTADTMMFDAFKELVEKIDFRLQGVGRAFGASGPSNISDNPNRQLGVVSISGTSSAKPIDFSTTVAVTNTAVNLASHALTNGCIVQALLANTATSIKVGFTNAPTFELQPGQATSCAVPDTADIWINGTAGDGICVIGS